MIDVSLLLLFCCILRLLLQLPACTLPSLVVCTHQDNVALISVLEAFDVSPSGIGGGGGVHHGMGGAGGMAGACVEY